jgi:hypothetical protein
MWCATRLVVIASIAWQAGCDSPPATSPASADAEFGGWTWDALKPADRAGDEFGVSAAWGSWKKRLAYVIVTDGTASSSTVIDRSDARTRYIVSLTWPSGRSTEVRLETTDGRTGTITCAGRSHDLALGAVFAVLPKTDEFEVQQFHRDLSRQSSDIAGVVNLIRNDPELIRKIVGGNQQR